jgi:hypothetical protein
LPLVVREGAVVDAPRTEGAGEAKGGATEGVGDAVEEAASPGCIPSDVKARTMCPFTLVPLLLGRRSSRTISRPNQGKSKINGTILDDGLVRLTKDEGIRFTTPRKP